jgi:uncharacterized protein (TIGR04255 family)
MEMHEYLCTMSAELSKLKKAPVIEAIIEFDCDMPPKFKVAEYEEAFKATYSVAYPEFRTVYAETHEIQSDREGTTSHSAQRAVDGHQFWNAEKTELVQVRNWGFSFNRLKPYSTLDDYLPTIKLNWGKFAAVGQPIQLKALRMRFINRIELPSTTGNLELKDYLSICPQLPNGSNLVFTGFYHQHQAVEKETGNIASIVLATQPYAKDHLPLIFDITVISPKVTEPDDWQAIEEQFATLRRLKNSIFANTLTETCLSLCQP